MKLSKVEIELIIEGLKAIRNGYDTRNCENVVNRIDDPQDRLKSMDKVNIASFFLAGMSLLGNYFVNKKNVLGFYIWIVANVLWALLYYYIDQRGSGFLMLMYIILCFHGVYSWNKIKEDSIE